MSPCLATKSSKVDDNLSQLKLSNFFHPSKSVLDGTSYQPSRNCPSVQNSCLTIDGKQYYVENGVVKKNTAIELDGRLYYFDETGAMVDQSKPLYRADAIPNNSIYAVYNQAYDTSSKSFEHLDNFLTCRRPGYKPHR